MIEPIRYGEYLKFKRKMKIKKFLQTLFFLFFWTGILGFIINNILDLIKNSP
jgi:hypothetical protein